MEGSDFCDPSHENWRKLKCLIFAKFHENSRKMKVFLKIHQLGTFCWHIVIYKSPVARGHLQIPCGTRSFTKSPWHGVIYKFLVARGHSEHNSFDASSFNPKGNHRLPWAPSFANSLCMKNLFNQNQT